MNMLRRMMRKEAGQALPMALVLVLLGVMIIIPTLSFTTTNLNATRSVDQHTKDTYAADAGIEDGLWKVKNNYLPTGMMGDWCETTYATYEQNPYIYKMYDSDDENNVVTVNNREVEINIKPLWVLETLETPSLLQGDPEHPERGYGRTPIDRLLIFGGLNGDGDYEISIFRDATLDPLMIERIGCWLPPGFHYDGSNNLGKVPALLDHNGGQAVTWNFSPAINYTNLPAEGSKRVVTFKFTPKESPTDAFCWTRTTQAAVKLSWDTSRKAFEIESRAPSGSAKQTTIVAHSIKKEFQPLGSAISGDYQATGKTLMRNDNSSYDYKRERLYNETWSTIKSKTEDSKNGIPDDAVVEKIFLYWSGWKCKPWNPTDAQLTTLPADKHVNEVAFKVKVGGVEMPRWKVTANESKAIRNTWDSDPNGWSYSCFADITNQVVDYFKVQGVTFRGIAQYTVGHWDISSTPNASTYRYYLYTWNDNHNLEPNPGATPVPPLYAKYPLCSPRSGGEWRTRSWPYERYWYDYTYEDQQNSDEDYWAYGAWSVLVIYSSPSSAGHHLYISDDFKYCGQNSSLDFPIKGFLAPPDVASDPNAARMTCFVGEGDNEWTGDNLYLNNYRLNGNAGDTINPVNNVWNSKSNVLGTTSNDDGIDIDTFSAGGGTIIKPWDTQATVHIPTGTDVWNLVYIVLSFRSEITTGGMIDYTIK